MTDSNDKSLERHFEFGENWAAYSETIDQLRIRKAEEALLSLMPQSRIEGASFLDIGCGSGLHSLAALNLGASSVRAFDIDPNSVTTTRKVLKSHAGTTKFQVDEASIFEMPLSDSDKFDIVYSWGVLHHTGDMWPAIQQAAQYVKKGGLFVIALYLKTPFCGIWKVEKRLFTKTPKPLRYPIIWSYCGLCWVRVLLNGQNPMNQIKEYQKSRGMNWYHDKVDWLGGYPYESASPDEVEAFVQKLGGKLERSLRTRASIGLLGSRCAEYAFLF